MKKSIITILCIVAFVTVLVIVGNEIVIANQIMLVTNIYCVYGFYAALLLLVSLFVIAPIIRLIKMPKIAQLTRPNTDISDEDLYAIGKNLAKTFPKDRIEEKDDFDRKVFEYGISQPSNQREIICQEIDNRLQSIDEKIKRYGKRVFILTAISQNSRFDTISVLILNFRMINDLIKSTGFRPGYYQLFQIYWRVLMTGAFAYATSEVSEMADELFLSDIGTEIGEKVGNETLGKLLGIFTKSIADGAVNGMFTLRIGFVTKKYIEIGFNQFKDHKQRISVYKHSIKEAWNCRKNINDLRIAV